MELLNKDKGLGDTVARFTTITGIKKITESITTSCGCNRRRDKLNKYFPYKNK